MLRIGEVVEELRLWVFEKSKVPFEVKVLGVATCIQTSSVRRTARILSELHPVSKTSVWNWIRKFEERLPVVSRRRKDT
ncbi:MAG: hypothetical protein ACXQTM_01000 [Methanosarcinales archaeon]